MTTTRDLPLLAITLGDPGGIGPEVAFGAAAHAAADGYRPLLVGSVAVARAHAARLGVDVRIEAMEHLAGLAEVSGDALPLLDVSEGADLDVPWGRATAAGGRLSMRAVEAATRLCLAGEAAAMVTAPISKEAIALAGHDVPGHTEFIARLCGASGREVMLLAAGRLRVALVTVHVPLRRVPDLVTAEAILSRRRTLEASLRDDFGVAAPRVAVLGLNPHAGDGGVLGMEETDVIAPAIAAARAEGLVTDGPVAADGFFALHGPDGPVHGGDGYDAVLAMYHDQGLAPFKALAFDRGVNVTIGLPVVRTSPDHGTAYGIAGCGLADAASMRAACRLAVDVARRRVAR